MKYLIIFTIIILLVVLYYGGKVIYTKHISGKLISKTTLYKNESGDYTKTLLVLGDSTAVGVGATDKNDSVPALVASKIGATYTENYAVSGAEVGQLDDQIKHIKRDRYDMILVQIGANDILARNDVLVVSIDLERVLTDLKSKTNKLVFLTAGNMGDPEVIPFFLKSYYTNLTLSYHSSFEKIAEKLGITYVNLYEDASIDPFTLDPDTYYASDKFHPSSAGYAHWFKKVVGRL